MREAPGVALHVAPTQKEDGALLRDGTIDLALGVYDYAPYSDLSSDLRIQQLFEDHFVCVVRDDHPSVGRALTIQQFAELEHLQVAPRGDPGGYVDDLLAAQGHTRRIARAVPYFLAALAIVAETDYVLTISSRLAQRLAGTFGLRIVQPPRSLGLEPYQIAQLWHPRNDRDGAHRWLRDAVVKASRSARAR
jgi:DNA-binding transcriptional LysR family regulator